jgi:integrase/recombinase XerD
MLADVVESYLATRRACGFKLDSVGKHLQSFAAYSDAMTTPYVCAEVAIQWAGSARSLTQRARLLGEIARFARYARADDPRHEVPPPAFGRDHRNRPVPYIFSKDDVDRLVQAAFQPAYYGLRRDTYSTLFALLACTGLRVSEAIGLRYDDVTEDGLVIRCSKFRKSRLVPLHGTAQAQLEQYLERRRRYGPFDDHVFISLYGRPLRLNNVESAFRTAAMKIGIPCGLRCSPRATPHSLRHTFAVRALENCPDDRDHITKNMLALSTYLGHSNVANTYWYLEATPDLMSRIAERCEKFVTGEKP